MTTAVDRLIEQGREDDVLDVITEQIRVLRSRPQLAEIGMEDLLEVIDVLDYLEALTMPQAESGGAER